MKNTILILSLLFVQFALAQVGVGTTTPTSGYELDVAGSLIVQEEFKVGAFPKDAIQPTDKFLFRRLSSSPANGEVVVLDMTELDRAPINVINYYFTDVYRDNIASVDLQFDADEFVVGLSNVRYVGDVITKGNSVNGSYSDIGHFISRTFIDNGTNTWHLEIGNISRDAATSSNITYYVTLIIYDKKYFKILDPISVDFGGATIDSAAIPSGL